MAVTQWPTWQGKDEDKYTPIWPKKNKWTCMYEKKKREKGNTVIRAVLISKASLQMRKPDNHPSEEKQMDNEWGSKSAGVY